ncbi:MAG TPA: hypothetical protein VF240_17515 [Pyrinomonadaceae bacterium]
MTNRRTNLLAFAAAALFSLLLPTAANAQQGPWWGQGRNDDNYGRRNGRLSDQDRRVLRDVARRIDDRSGSFQRNVDRALDRSRIDDTPREDNINDRVRDFRRAAERFRNRAGDSNNINNSRGEAQQLLNSAANIDRLVRRVRLDGRAQSDWSQIRADLRTVASFYNLRLSDYDSNDGIYGRDDRRDNRRAPTVQWPRNWPRPF